LRIELYIDYTTGFNVRSYSQNNGII